MKKFVLAFMVFSFSVQPFFSQQSQSDICETIAQEAGCAAYEAGHVTWEGHYTIIDIAYNACMSQNR